MKKLIEKKLIEEDQEAAGVEEGLGSGDQAAYKFLKMRLKELQRVRDGVKDLGTSRWAKSNRREAKELVALAKTLDKSIKELRSITAGVAVQAGM